MRRLPLTYGLLFAGSFAATTGYIILQQPIGDTPRLALASLTQQVTGLARTVTSDQAASGAGTPGTTTPNPVATVDVRALEAQRMNQFATVAMNSTDPTERREAISELAGTATPDSLYALATAAHAPDRTVRLAAIDSLRLLAANQGDGDGQIRGILRNSLGDTGEGIAERAREAIAEINSLQAP